MKIYFFSLLTLFLISEPVLGAGPEIMEADTYYDIHGKTLEELFSEMHHKGGRTNGAAWTDWDIHWKVDYAKT